MSISSIVPSKSVLALLMVGGLFGCADAAEPESEKLEPDPQAQIFGSTTTGLEISAVSMKGTGCPANTAHPEVSSDGLAFNLTFSDYGFDLEPTDNQDAISLNCDVTVKFKTPTGLSFAVTQFGYSGYAYLDPGVTASVRANYHFLGGVDAILGNPSKVLRGPYDNSFVYSTPVTLASWSDCGSLRDLVINTSIVGNNTLPKRAGHLNLNAMDAETKKQRSIFFRLMKRNC